MINEINVLKRAIGVNYSDGVSIIWLWAPSAKSITLKSGDVLIALDQQDRGYWFAASAALKPGDLYYFIIDGHQLPDPASLSQPEGVHGPSQVVNLEVPPTFNDKGWKNIPLNKYIIYELHTGTFSPEGTFAGIESKLDHLVELGITAIEIMPVAQFPGERNWGYDGVFPFAVQASYGGAEGLNRLVNACHARGLAVILDVVYNHVGPEGNYFSEFGPYFTEKYNTPWGSAINFDDEWCDGVRHYFVENVLMWFRDFHIDALRMDAVHAIKDFGAQHILAQIKENVDQLQSATGRTHYLIVELDLNDTRFIDPLEKRGFGMDAQWIDEFHHALRVTAGGDTNGYYSDFEGIIHLEKAYKDAYVYDGIYSSHRHKIFGSKADANPGEQFIVFSQNHDQVGNRMLGERSSQLFSFEMQKLMAGAVLCSPFLPMLFMGEEWSEKSPFLYFVSHTDPELIKAVQKGRKDEFLAFHNEGEAPDPQGEATFEQSKLKWENLSAGVHATMFNFYKALIRLRKEYPALNNTNRKQMEVSAEVQRNCLFLRRWEKEEQIVCLLNFSQTQQSFTLPVLSGSWIKLFDSADTQWGGTISAPESIEAFMQITLQPESFILYKNTSKHV